MPSIKKNAVSAAVFIAVFLAVYLVLCFAVPGLRIKLAAEPTVYFIESIRSMAFIKSAVSFAVALFAVKISMAIPRTE